jgi:enoyl-CoA hydratase/carnithine racemase
MPRAATRVPLRIRQRAYTIAPEAPASGADGAPGIARAAPGAYLVCMSLAETHAAIDAVWRTESAKVIAGLARRVGAMRALELVASARTLKADEAKAVGLCLDVFPADVLMLKVREIAAGIASKGPVAVRSAKAVLRRGLDGPVGLGNALEAEAFANLFDSADAREGMTAFVEKRPAHFRNA